MKYAENRAWLFQHPDLDGGQAGLVSDHTGKVALAGERQAIRQALLILLTTTPGERVMRTGYGCNLFQLVFSPNDDTTAGLAIHHIRQAVERWERRIEILKLDARRAEGDPARLAIELEYRLRRTGQRDQFLYSFALEGDGNR